MPDVVPLMFFEKGNSVPSCGLLTALVGGKAPAFIKLVGFTEVQENVTVLIGDGVRNFARIQI